MAVYFRTVNTTSCVIYFFWAKHGLFFSVYLRAALRVIFFFFKKYVSSCAYSSYEPVLAWWQWAKYQVVQIWHFRLWSTLWNKRENSTEKTLLRKGKRGTCVRLKTLWAVRDQTGYKEKVDSYLHHLTCQTAHPFLESSPQVSSSYQPYPMTSSDGWMKCWQNWRFCTRTNFFISLPFSYTSPFSFSFLEWSWITCGLAIEHHCFFLLFF